ncbi:DUF2802 domain-containing protein [Vibrio scophthalmi]|uniref:DNA repair protein n=1 Tax=Vibrio scophthalmi TaxID=45658 RepID=A0A1E3WLZ0_9VIBR|nr:MULTISPECIES: DUF2802 domain-containing protein [Vibrio]EGU36298.1 hypothetical protein VIBRN418_15303 [Vibrio sp. N418]ODS10791.1 hypothetical protein VSF3289_01051 [Vibrio scophthalmi]
MNIDTGWFNQAPAITAGVISFILLVLLFSVLRLKRNQRLATEQSRQQQRHLERELQKANKQLLEVRSVVIGLGQKVSEQEDIIQHLLQRIKELEQADGDGRMYSRATKMVQLGADLNELIEECELPKAEAELMMSLQNKLSGREKIPPLEGMPDQSLQKRRRMQMK